MSDPYMYEAGHITSFEHGLAGKVPMQAQPIRMSRTPASIRSAPPVLGEHSEHVLSGWLGIGREEFFSLKARAVV